jgi:hypothetical protein
MLTKEHAQKIAKKLKAVTEPRSAHDMVEVWYEGKLIATFGIRRGSRKDQGHDHIPGKLHLNARDCLSLAQCTMSYDQWIQRMKDKGLIEEVPVQRPTTPPAED